MAFSELTVRLGTRSSKLARWQAEHVRDLLVELGVTVEIIFIETTGDLDKVRDFGALGAKGIFVKEIEAALLNGEIDIAVHSLKDLPTDLPEGLALGAALERELPFDALVSRERCALADLPEGGSLATGSLRRATQIQALRPDLKVGPLRGNVPTRIRKIREGAEADATLLALAGMRRLGFEGEIDQVFTIDEVTPAMGQGAVAIETRTGELLELMAELNHEATRIGIDAERVFVARIGGGCKTPVGVYARPEDDGWAVTAMVASEDGSALIRDSRASQGAAGINAAALELAESILDRATESMLRTLDPKPITLPNQGDAS